MPAEPAPAARAGRPDGPVERRHRVGLRPSRVPALPPSSGLRPAKLTVGAPGDKWEREADQIADSVVRRRNLPARPAQGGDSSRAERAGTDEEHEPAVSATGAVRSPVSGGRGGRAPDSARSALAQAAGGGGPLDDKVRTAMEEQLGADFSGVRVHRDAAAQDLSRKFHAAAFTVGRDIFLPAAAPSLAAPGGQRLLAHELAHVLQQGVAPAGAPVIQRQRDLKPQTPVEFPDLDGGHMFRGTVTSMWETGGLTSYRVTDETGETNVLGEERVKAVDPNEPLKKGSKVRAMPWNKELDGTVEEVITRSAEQYYDITVEWEEGWQVPVPYLVAGVPESGVVAMEGADFAPRATKKAKQVEVTHFYPGDQPTPNAAEYVKPGRQIDITSHALGSGIYGIHQPSEEFHKAAGAKSTYKTQNFSIDNPLVVQNMLHGEELIKLGKLVNGMAQRLHKERLGNLTLGPVRTGKDPGLPKVGAKEVTEAVERNADDLKSLLVRVFGRAGLEVPGTSLIEEALIRFFQRYDDPDSKFVDQPTTIFLAELYKLGGIYGDEESGLNVYSKGNVAFVPPGKKFARKVGVGTEPEWTE
jgi:hypothetical protein